MIVPVFTPPSRIDSADVDDFAGTVDEFVARYRGMVLDCTGVEWIASSALRILAIASCSAPITLVNPSPAVHLMATTFAHDVLCQFDRCESGRVAS
jgi:anti-anti-sigma regulatory factor